MKYCTFGRVIKGTEAIDKLKAVDVKMSPNGANSNVCDGRRREVAAGQIGLSGTSRSDPMESKRKSGPTQRPADAAGNPPPVLFTVRSLDEQILCFELDGPMTLDSLRTVAATIMATCVRRGFVKAIADARLQTGDLPIFEWHTLATGFELSWPRAVRLAIVDKPERIKPDRFLETTARNRGIDVMVFSEFDAAVEWLKGSR